MIGLERIWIALICPARMLNIGRTDSNREGKLAKLDLPDVLKNVLIRGSGIFCYGHTELAADRCYGESR